MDRHEYMTTGEFAVGHRVFQRIHCFIMMTLAYFALKRYRKTGIRLLFHLSDGDI